jgi:SAM-dependent methyltransferase
MAFKYFLKNSAHIIISYGPVEAFYFFQNYFRFKKKINTKINTIKADFELTEPGESYNKYLDTGYWIFENLKRIYVLELHKQKPKSILDLGTGAGYFPYLCKQYGHHVVALDMDNNDMYNKIISLLGIDRINHKISFGQDLPLLQTSKFDLITAFMICFNNHKQENLWHTLEWEWLLSLLFKHVYSDGKIFLSFNEESAKNPLDEDLKNYFLKYNPIVNQIDFMLNKPNSI